MRAQRQGLVTAQDTRMPEWNRNPLDVPWRRAAGLAVGAQDMLGTSLGQLLGRVMSGGPQPSHPQFLEAWSGFPSLRSSGFPGLGGPRGSVAGWEEYSFGFCTERQSEIIAPCLPQGLTPCLAGSWMLAGSLREQIPAWAQPRRAARHTVTDPSESNTPMWARMLQG